MGLNQFELIKNIKILVQRLYKLKGLDYKKFEKSLEQELETTHYQVLLQYHKACRIQVEKLEMLKFKESNIDFVTTKLWTQAKIRNGGIKPK